MASEIYTSRRKRLKVVSGGVNRVEEQQDQDDSFLNDTIRFEKLEDYSLIGDSQVPESKLEERLEDLKKLLLDEKRKTDSLRKLIARNQGVMLKVANYRGDYEDLKQGYSKKKEELEVLKIKNKNVEKKIEAYTQIQLKSTEEIEKTKSILVSKLSALVEENSRFDESNAHLVKQMKELQNVSYLK